jgi:BirA family transcriptional regulator, biotin operon repressor / biotin---[acetyl-CoA-carboxylase] ligase
MMQTSFVSADSLRAGTLVRYAEVHERLGSTNDRAAEIARDLQVELPAVVVARQQTAGRGRAAKVWWAGDGALTFSILLEPAAFGIGTAGWPQLSLTTAVAVRDALQPEVTPSLRVKWPNDVMLRDRKVSGILIESPGGAPPATNCLIIGVGINVNNSWRDAPADAGECGIALCDVSGRQHELTSVLTRFLHRLPDRFRQLAAGDASLPQLWQQLCWLKGQTICIASGNRRQEGLCHGISPSGALAVAHRGSVEHFYGGSVVATSRSSL